MRIAIIGGAGKMGTWLADLLIRDGKPVIICGRDQSKLAKVKASLPVDVMSTTAAARAADIVILSVPIDSLEPVLQEISPFLQQGQLVVDISSVKSKPVELMHRYIKGATVLGAHPLFGPGAHGLSGQNVVLTPTSPEEEARANRVAVYLQNQGARVTFTTPEEHDELMSAVLGLTHFIGIVGADALASTGKLNKMLDVAGTSFRLLLTLAESVLSEDPAFYASLQMNLPVADIESRLVECAREWMRLVNDRDSAGFAARMTSLREALKRADPDFDEAYRRMYRINGIWREPGGG